MGLLWRPLGGGAGRDGAPGGAGGVEAAEERAVALVDRYLRESRAHDDFSWNVKPVDYPSGREILAAEPRF